MTHNSHSPARDSAETLYSTGYTVQGERQRGTRLYCQAALQSETYWPNNDHGPCHGPCPGHHSDPDHACRGPCRHAAAGCGRHAAAGCNRHTLSVQCSVMPTEIPRARRAQRAATPWPHAHYAKAGYSHVRCCCCCCNRPAGSSLKALHFAPCYPTLRKQSRGGAGARNYRKATIRKNAMGRA